MAYSENMNSGVRSTFSRTCSLLSLYLKENGGFRDLDIGLKNPSTAPATQTKETLDLLPKMERSGWSSEADDGEVTIRSPEVEKGNQMTIFYGGEVRVFDDLPADVANEILMLAGKFNAGNEGYPSAFHSTTPSFESAPFLRRSYSLREPTDLTIDLPFARKHSLAWFLAKRKDRISANAPYQVSTPPHPKKPINEEPWLGLAPNSHLN